MHNRYLFLILISFSFSIFANEKQACELAKQHNLNGLGKIEFFEADINGDGVNDLFITETRGNGGGEYNIFVKNKDSYSKIGVVGIHPNAIQLIKADNAKTPKSILTYWHMSAFEGNLITYKFVDGTYKRINSKSIKSADYDKHLKPLKIESITVDCK